LFSELIVALLLVLLTPAAATYICVIGYCLQCCKPVIRANIAPEMPLKVRYLTLENPGILYFLAVESPTKQCWNVCTNALHAGLYWVNWMPTENAFFIFGRKWKCRRNWIPFSAEKQKRKSPVPISQNLDRVQLRTEHSQPNANDIFGTKTKMKIHFRPKTKKKSKMTK